MSMTMSATEWRAPSHDPSLGACHSVALMIFWAASLRLAHDHERARRASVVALRDREIVRAHEGGELGRSKLELVPRPIAKPKSGERPGGEFLPDAGQRDSIAADSQRAGKVPDAVIVTDQQRGGRRLGPS